MEFLRDYTNEDLSQRFQQWDDYFRENHLYRELIHLDGNGIHALDQFIQRLNQDAPEDYQHTPREKAVVRALLTCGGIACLDAGTAWALPRLLRSLNPQVKIPTLANSSVWQEYIRLCLEIFPWPDRLPAEWAWDAICAFRGEPRKVARSLTFSLALIECGEGITADLTLGLLEDGKGQLYPDPECMSFVQRSPTFLASLQNTVEFLRSSGLWTEAQDIRWKVVRQNRRPVSELAGKSAGAAFTLGMARLLQGESQRLPRQIDGDALACLNLGGIIYSCPYFSH